MTSFESLPLLPPDDFPPLSVAVTFALASARAASTMPCAVRCPLNSFGFRLLAPKILIVGNPLTPYCPPSDFSSSALTAPTLITP